MKVRLLFPDHDADCAAVPPPGADALIADLDLRPVLAAMVPERRLDGLCPAVLLNPLTDADAITWRQHVLADAMADPAGMRALFDLAGEALDSQRSVWMYGGKTADSALSRAVHSLRLLAPMLARLAATADAHREQVRSEGLAQLYTRLIAELDQPYLDELEVLLRQLEFPDGVVSRAHIDPAGVLNALELLASPTDRNRWRGWWGSGPARRRKFTIAERDEAGAQAVAALRNDAIFEVARTVSRSCDHVLAFFRQLRWETGFYVGCLALSDELQAAGVPLCWPVPEPPGTAMSAVGLRALSLAIRSGTDPEPNDLAGPTLELAVVTGANQGGKTTFLRSLGCAQVLLQAGMFVPALAFGSAIAPTVHTHFRRREDDQLSSGKLEEELVRMSEIVDRCRPGDLLLMNESFASTDEIEGTYLATEVIDALRTHGVRVAIVTHFHRLAQHYRDRGDATFLAAERRDDGRRTYRIVPGVPGTTSHALDIYREIFTAAGHRPPTVVPRTDRLTTQPRSNNP